MPRRRFTFPSNCFVLLWPPLTLLCGPEYPARHRHSKLHTALSGGYYRTTTDKMDDTTRVGLAQGRGRLRKVLEDTAGLLVALGGGWWNDKVGPDKVVSR